MIHFGNIALVILLSFSHLYCADTENMSLTGVIDNLKFRIIWHKNDTSQALIQVKEIIDTEFDNVNNYFVVEQGVKALKSKEYTCKKWYFTFQFPVSAVTTPVGNNLELKKFIEVYDSILVQDREVMVRKAIRLKISQYVKTVNPAE